jgi:hypothetical protein
MQRREHRHTGRRQIGVEIDAMHVDEVDRPAGERSRDRRPVARPGPLSGRLVEEPVFARHLDQLPGGGGARAGDDERAVAGRGKRPIERGQDLLRAAAGLDADRRQRIGNAEDRERHEVGSSPSSCDAASTR